MSRVSSPPALRSTRAMIARLALLILALLLVVAVACDDEEQDTPDPSATPPASPRTDSEQPFTGPLGDYFYIAAPLRDSLPPELITEPYPPGSCGDDFVPVTQADTPLYFELPAKIDGLDIAQTGLPQAVKCVGDLTSVQQFGRIQSSYGPGDVYVTRSYFYHPRVVTGYLLPRERYELSEVAGKPALVITSPGTATHVVVIVEPFRDGAPGTVLSVNADLTGPQAIELAEAVLASWG